MSCVIRASWLSGESADLEAFVRGFGFDFRFYLFLHLPHIPTHPENVEQPQIMTLGRCDSFRGDSVVCMSAKCSMACVTSTVCFPKIWQCSLPCGSSVSHDQRKHLVLPVSSTKRYDYQNDSGTVRITRILASSTTTLLNSSPLCLYVDPQHIPVNILHHSQRPLEVLPQAATRYHPALILMRGMFSPESRRDLVGLIFI